MSINRRDFVAGCGGAALTGLAMSDASAQSAPRRVESLNAPIYTGAPVLIVKDLAAVSRYYEERIGLARIDADSDTARLGAGGVVLLTLRKRANAEREPETLAGLYHTAFLVPSSGELGVWLRRAIEAKVEFDGASDHLVSESFYLSDPEGNGIEVYADRPRATWRWNGDLVEMRNSAPDIRGIIGEAASIAAPSAGMPDGTRVGHVHMRVGDIDAAEQFYQKVLGFDVTRRREGATFYATGRYHHHLATNVWQSRGSPKRPGTTTGLAVLSLVAADGKAFDAGAERMLAAGGKRAGNTITAEDPWGNIAELSKA